MPFKQILMALYKFVAAYIHVFFNPCLHQYSLRHRSDIACYKSLLW